MDNNDNSDSIKPTLPFIISTPRSLWERLAAQLRLFRGYYMLGEGVIKKISLRLQLLYMFRY